MNDLEKLVADEEMRRLMGMWCSAMDNQDWGALRSIFTDDAVLRNMSPEEEGSEISAARYVEWLSALPLNQVRTVHHFHNLRVDFSSSAPTSRSEFLAAVWNTGTMPAAFKVQYTWGTYSVSYRKTPLGWRMVEFMPEVHHQISGGFGSAPPRPPPARVTPLQPSVDVHQLTAIRQIRELKARYCSAVDQKDWTALRNLFTDDAVFGMFAGARPDSADQFVAFLSRGLKLGSTSVHHVHNPRIELTSSTSATGQWELEYWNWFGGEALDGGHGFGAYKEHYRRTSDGWRIAALGAAPPAGTASAAAEGVRTLAPGESERLRAIQDVKYLRARCCAASDASDWSALRREFTEDAVLELQGEGGAPIMTPEGFAQSSARAATGIKTVHHLHNFHAEFTSATELQGRWEAVKYTWRTEAGPSPFSRRVEWVSFHDRYVRTADAWRLAAYRASLNHATEERP